MTSLDLIGLPECEDVPEGYGGWRLLLDAHLNDLKRDLIEYEERPLRDLRREERIKSIPFESIRREARTRLEELELADERLSELRLPSGARVWGLLYGGTFHLIWWDPDHRVCRGKDRRR